MLLPLRVITLTLRVVENNFSSGQAATAAQAEAQDATHVLETKRLLFAFCAIFLPPNSLHLINLAYFFPIWFR